MQKGFDNLISQLKKCELCKEKFGFQPHPIILGNVNSKIVQISQAPSATVHETLKPFTDLSGKKIKYDDLKNVADGIVFEQRMNSERYKKLFSTSSIVKYIKSNDNNVWHRFPIWVDDEKIYNYIIKKLSCTELEYQLPHKIELSELKRNKNSVHYNYNIHSKLILLLRTRNINIDKQIKILEGIIDNLV